MFIHNTENVTELFKRRPDFNNIKNFAVVIDGIVKKKKH